MQKKSQKQTKPIKQIVLFIIAVILLLLIIFAEDIIKLNNKNKMNLAENSENELISNEPNAPQLSAGMIPVKWDGENWVITTSKDKDWYDYSEGKPAYIMLNDGTYQSELIRDMNGKKLVSDVVGNDAPVVPPDQLGTIFVWIPRFAEDDNEEEIRYVKEETMSGMEWTISRMFSYEVEDETKPNYSLSGVWIAKDVDSEYEDTINEMNKEESIYGFIKNTNARRVLQYSHVRRYINKLSELVADGEFYPQINDITNYNRIMLQVINTNKVEPIKAKVEYNENTGLINVEVTYSRYGISKILYKGNQEPQELNLTKNGNKATANSEGLNIEYGIAKITIIDNEGNRKEFKIRITSKVYAKLYTNGTLAFSSDNEETLGEVSVDYGDISGKNFTYESRAPWYKDRANITTVEFVNEISPTSTACWFYSCAGLRKINKIQNLNTSNVTNMEGMFCDCLDLTELDVSNFDTSNVTNMAEMFSNCENLIELDVSNFNTSNVTNMANMFDSCRNLTELNLSSFNTSNVTDMSWMFYGCSSLTELDLSNFDTSNLTNMRSMFSTCNNLIELDVSNFNTSNVTDMRWMFAYCGVLNKLDLGNFDTNKATSVKGMFSECASLSEISFGQKWNKEITLPTGTTWYKESSYTDKIAEGGAVYTPTVPITIYGKTLEKGIYVKLYEGGTLVFASHNGKFSSVSSADYGNILGKEFKSPSQVPWNNDRTNIITVEFVNEISPTSTAYWFYNCTNLRKINKIQNLNTSNVTNMYSMFEGCSSLTELDVSNFNTDNVTDMSWMFYGCSSLTELDVSNFDTGNVKDMSYMFRECSSLTELDVSNFNTGNVTDMSDMFCECSSLTKLDVSNFNTSNVTDMSWMFCGCSSLTELNLSKFDTSNVTNMRRMFYRCSSLKKIYVGKNWITAQADTTQMFDGCGVTSVTDINE